MRKRIKPKKQDPPKCEDCGIAVGVTWRECPFAADVRNRIEMHWLCERCTQERANDI